MTLAGLRSGSIDDVESVLSKENVRGVGCNVNDVHCGSRGGTMMSARRKRVFGIFEGKKLDKIDDGSFPRRRTGDGVKVGI